jgi:spore coat polysaccharide biosynthesis predicted glycosyltransferase SpsG
MAVSNQNQNSVMLSTRWVHIDNLRQALKEISLSQNDQLIYSGHHYLPSREVFPVLEKHLTAK